MPDYKIDFRIWKSPRNFYGKGFKWSLKIIFFENYIVWVNTHKTLKRSTQNGKYPMLLVFFIHMYRCLYLNLYAFWEITKLCYNVFYYYSGGYDHGWYLFSSMPLFPDVLQCTYTIFIIRKRDNMFRVKVRF